MLLRKSALLTVAILLLWAAPLGAAGRQLELPKKPTQSSTNSSSVLATLEVVGPVTISEEEIELANAYQAHLGKVKAWHTEALVVAERLGKEGKLYPPVDPNDVDKYGFVTVPSFSVEGARHEIKQTGRFDVPASVLEQMPARPGYIAVPPGTRMELRLKLLNSSTEAATINEMVYCDAAHIEIDITGPNAFRMPQVRFHVTTDWRPGRRITLQPGESHVITIKSLAFGGRGISGNWLLCKAGTHSIKIDYFCGGIRASTPKTDFEVVVAPKASESTGAAEKVSVRLEIEEPVRINRADVELADAYERYLNALNEWQTEAIELAENLIKEDKLFPKDGQLSKDEKWLKKHFSIGNCRLMRNKYRLASFPESVMKQMRPRPKPVAISKGTQLKMLLHLTNRFDEPIHINSHVFCDLAQIRISISGPRVFRMPQRVFVVSRDWRPGNVITLQPGETCSIPINGLKYGIRGISGDWAVREAGEHTISVDYSCRRLPKQRIHQQPKPRIFETATATFDVEWEN